VRVGHARRTDVSVLAVEVAKRVVEEFDPTVTGHSTVVVKRRIENEQRENSSVGAIALVRSVAVDRLRLCVGSGGRGEGRVVRDSEVLTVPDDRSRGAGGFGESADRSPSRHRNRRVLFLHIDAVR